MLFRPPEYLEDVRERELEIRAIESRLGGARDEVHGLRLRGRARLPRLPGLHDEAPAGVRDVQPAARARLAGLPVLRDAGPGRREPVALQRPPRANRTTRSRHAPVQAKLRGRMAVERTLILAKPDAVERSLAGEIVARFERRGLKLRAARLVVASRELGETHYAEHREKPFFGELVDFITSGPTLAFVLEGEGAIATARKTIGATNPADADPGSLRGEFALAMPNNLVHGSDSPESAEREIGLWFPDGLV